MFRKKDLLVIVVVLCVAAVLYGVTRLSREGETLSGAVHIYAEGALYTSAPLKKSQEIRVEQSDERVNVVSIQDGVVRMHSSTCKNQLCVQQGEITLDNWTTRAMGRSIICLPNQVVVELAVDGEGPSLDMDAPDI